MFINVLRGFLMGSADIVPGVSGGTVALVLGIYERLVHNIREGAGVLGDLARGHLSEARSRLRTIEWPFLLGLLGGIALAIVSLAQLLANLLDDHPEAMSGLFFGLIAGSIAVAWRVVRQWTAPLLGLCAATAASAFVVLGLRTGELGDPSTAAFFGAGALAIVAMILPGVSGSFVLLMIGMYESVLGAVNDREFGTLIVFGLGAVLGLAAFSTLLDRLLRAFHDIVMAMLVGVMVGSLRVLWPWPDGTDSAGLEAPTDWGLPLVLGLLGAIGVIGVARAVTAD